MLKIPGLYDEVEDINAVISSLSHPCYDCRLGHCQGPKQNRGFIWRGNPKAEIALVSIMPGKNEMETGKPLTGKSGQLSDKWFKYIKLDTNTDMFVTNVVQCKPPDVMKKDDDKEGQREPELDEMAACFPARCLRVLRAMPNLEVVVTLGWLAAKCLLGGSPTEVTHMGHWYTTSLLPNKAVYCLSHPAALLREAKKGDDDKGVPSAYLEKKYKVVKCLDRFRRTYLDTNKVIELVSED